MPGETLVPGWSQKSLQYWGLYWQQGLGEYRMGCPEKFWCRLGPKRASDIGGYIGSKVWGMIGARAWTQYGVAWANSWWPKARHVSWAYEFFGGILHVHFRSKMTILCCAKWRHVCVSVFTLCSTFLFFLTAEGAAEGETEEMSADKDDPAGACGTGMWCT